MKIPILTIPIVLKMISFKDYSTIIVSSVSKKKNMNTSSISNDIRTRLTALRQEMKEQSVDTLIVPTSDPHLSEYLPLHWRSREWLSGFTGSAGTLIVGMKKASLWVDSRYWTQAEKQLEGSGIEMCRVSGGAQIPYLKWIEAHLPAGATVAIDGHLLSLSQGRLLEKALTDNQLSFRPDVDLISSIWKDRASIPKTPVFEHTRQFVAMSRIDKIERIRYHMKESAVNWHLISTLDDIAWTFNLRGSDIEFNPVFIAYALIGPEKAVLFIDSDKLSDEIRKSLVSDGIEIKAYEEISGVLQRIPSGTAMLLDPRRTSYSMYRQVNSGVKFIETINPAVLLKSRKEAFEIENIRRTMIEDGAAFCEFQAWFDTAIENGNSRISELAVAEKIEEFRSKRPCYISPSFKTIAGFNENAALPHYQATETDFSFIEKDGLLLIDTGGQYLGGTTDMTRVIPVGLPGQEQKKDFTLVLKGMIALSDTCFPQSIPAAMLDSIARKPLWAHGADYGHGTGHGVGYFLNVHEGPQGISYHAKPEPQTAMEEGMVTSVEPGLYKEGRWGIRIENLVVNRFYKDTEFGRFLNFETLTQCPIDTRCIEKDLLDENEIAWLNRYHEGVRDKLMPFVPEHVKNWLIRRTEPL